MSAPAPAQAATITQCTRANVAAAVTAGGSHTFACDGRIVMSPPLTVSTTVSFDVAAGHAVTFAGSRPGEDTTFVSSARDARVVKVAATGDLTLRGITVEDGLFISAPGAAGRRGSNGTPGTFPGGAGTSAPDDAQPGTVAPAAQGGCILVEAGGRLVLRSLVVRRCQAAAGQSGASGAGGGGGIGGAGRAGASVPGQNGERGGDGGPGGPTGPDGIPGVPGAPAQGGAIYSAGELDLGSVQFEDNLARGGRGGRGGSGGAGGEGGRGGHGGAPGGGSTIGGDSGTPGAPGSARPGGQGGNGGAGHGGAVYAAGATSIVGTHFARNAALGGVAGIGGNGAGGQGAQLGQPGRYRVIGAPGDAACKVPGDNNEYRACGQYTLNSATSGANGGPNGDGGPAVGGAVFFQGVQPPPVNTTNDANRVQGGSNLAAECASTSPWNGCSEGGGGGRYLVLSCFETARCPQAASGSKGEVGKVGEASNADVGSDQGDGLSVTIAYDGDDFPGFRFPLEQPVAARVKVAVSPTAPGTISGITFG
ncbi:MAG: hypothetical protein JHD16_18225, partial [Solirubrobacteraceae bacterium]|nr:hypothetical protein [Solirubrobacteraceae bacterium]